MSGISDPQPIEQLRPSDDSDIVYVGYRRRNRVTVKRQPNQKRLMPEWALELANRSLSGFSWGYAGSGPAQLALTLLLDYTSDEGIALEEYMEFETKVVSQLKCTEPDGCWQLTGREVDTALCETAGEPVAPSVN